MQSWLGACGFGQSQQHVEFGTVDGGHKGSKVCNTGSEQETRAKAGAHETHFYSAETPIGQNEVTHGRPDEGVILIARTCGTAFVQLVEPQDLDVAALLQCVGGCLVESSTQGRCADGEAVDEVAMPEDKGHFLGGLRGVGAS